MDRLINNSYTVFKTHELLGFWRNLVNFERFLAQNTEFSSELSI